LEEREALHASLLRRRPGGSLLNAGIDKIPCARRIDVMTLGQLRNIDEQQAI
jgi:hypothetical protein